MRYLTSIFIFCISEVIRISYSTRNSKWYFLRRTRKSIFRWTWIYDPVIIFISIFFDTLFTIHTNIIVGFISSPYTYEGILLGIWWIYITLWIVKHWVFIPTNTKVCFSCFTNVTCSTSYFFSVLFDYGCNSSTFHHQLRVYINCKISVWLRFSCVFFPTNWYFNISFWRCISINLSYTS